MGKRIRIQTNGVGIFIAAYSLATVIFLTVIGTYEYGFFVLLLSACLIIFCGVIVLFAKLFG